ncbi:hypothetical protein PTT_15816 [Pyrenophora teres f. teres 0-1]|uniref:Uncharacterized protein n=1 Tax=Pyrenophora teres f. teres (strain 0-1) TaxID=861557 RepID=E3S105_PYRTT|nr:hypothetical protein PTT_15816 [Pyrenophora teres f. teres 0-1]
MPKPVVVPASVALEMRRHGSSLAFYFINNTGLKDPDPAMLGWIKWFEAEDATRDKTVNLCPG